MSGDNPRVTRVRRTKITKINEIGRAAIMKVLEPDYAFSVTDLGPDDRVTLTVTVTVTESQRPGEPAENFEAYVNLDFPAKMLEEVT